MFEIGGERLHAGPDDTIFGPRGSLHTLLNIGTAPEKRWLLLYPVGSTGFQELSVAVPPGAPPDPVALQSIFTKYGLELLGPPLNNDEILTNEEKNKSKAHRAGSKRAV